MGYNQALEAAGAEVLLFQYFGSYQGDWYALVNYQGTKQWVHGSYGSCSYCDAFDGEFDYTDPYCEEHMYGDKVEDCADCKGKADVYQKKLAEFGASYLGNTMTQEEAEAYASRNLEWDSEAPEMLKFLQDNSTTKESTTNA